MAYIPQQQWVVSTEFDPTVNRRKRRVPVTTTSRPVRARATSTSANAYQFVGREQNGFGKAGGLGDIAYAAANAPIQIGNLMWYDGDHNGIQDPAEVLLPDATINLLDAGGKQVATTRTDAAGEYYFGGVGAAYRLTPGAKYTVQFDVCTADTSKVPSQPPATKLRFTLPLAGSNRAHDSNVIPPTTGQLCNGHAPVTAPGKPGGGRSHDRRRRVHPPGSTADFFAVDAPCRRHPCHPPSRPRRGAEHRFTGPYGYVRPVAGDHPRALLLGAGAVFAFVSRKRRTQRH